MRLPSGGAAIDRDRPLTFTLDGEPVSGFAGDTVASALLAADRIEVGGSTYRDRPRGILTAGAAEPHAFVQVESWPSGAAPEPMRAMTTLEAVDGMRLRTLRGVGRLGGADRARYDAMYVHVDTLVVGGGPAGLSAARSAAGRVLLVEEQPALAGPAPDGVRALTRASAFGHYDQNYVLVLERRTDHLTAPARKGVSRQRVWHVRAGRVVYATGALERPLVFADNDRPGIMLASAVQTYLHRFAVVPGRAAVVATVDDSAYLTALDLVTAGVPVAALVDSRAEPPVDLAARLAASGVEVIAGAHVTGSDGSDRSSGGGRLRAVRVGSRSFEADLLAVCGGWSPDLHLWLQSRGTTRWDAARSAHLPDRAFGAVEVIGAATGIVDPQREASGDRVSPSPVWLPGTGSPEDQFVDLHRDATVADVARAVGAGMRHLEHIKRYTTIGTGHDQGRTAGLNAAGVVAALTGRTVGELGATGQRAPSHPVSFAALAGREVGPLADPVRTTPIHPWHVAAGAVFEDVGQWKRPRWYPLPGESMDDAVLRECAAARTGVAMMDASTLGSIEIVGPDAGEFLNRMYTNAFAKLAVGSIRYGLMWTPDGMVLDDGVTMRLAPDRFLMSTTTGNAARVLDWLEEWLQTEWPQLQVSCTSVTEQWSTVAVVGPSSRELVGRVVPGLDVSNGAFGFMTFRDTRIRLGEKDVPVRVARISFSGELAFELKISGWYGLSLWSTLVEAGTDLGVTPYGTETMHVLRAEKGYPIIGQETDGTVTPHDLGMSWVVSKTKDFVGRRSLRRADAARADRRQLVALLPADPRSRLAEGAQVVAEGVDPDAVPVPMIGHVTSSYRSAALGRTFALALISGGRDRIGQSVTAFDGSVAVAATIAEPVLYDPEGARRDG